MIQNRIGIRMDSSLSTAASRSSDIFSQRGRTASRTQSRLPSYPTRKYDITYLTPNGQVVDLAQFARIHPTFDSAFSVLSHSAVLQTSRGHATVEDVLPGDQIRMSDGNFDTLLWLGSIAIDPNTSNTAKGSTTLTRITGDTFGFNRPAPDLVLGSAARLLHRASGVRKLTGCDAAFIPAADFVDGNNILALQPTKSVRLYQLGFATQRSLSVNGIEVETLHPGTAFALGLRGEEVAEYMSLFPHKSSLEDFGLMENPRLRLRDLELIG